MEIFKKKRLKQRPIAETEKKPLQNNTVFRWDYAKTIFLWQMREPHEIKKDESYPKLFVSELGIKSPERFHEQMVSEGYLVKSDYVTSLGLYSTEEIKSIADALGLSAKEDKETLIKRLIEKTDEKQLSRICMDV